MGLAATSSPWLYVHVISARMSIIASQNHSKSAKEETLQSFCHSTHHVAAPSNSQYKLFAILASKAAAREKALRSPARLWKEATNDAWKVKTRRYEAFEVEFQ